MVFKLKKKNNHKIWESLLKVLESVIGETLLVGNSGLIVLTWMIYLPRCWWVYF